MGINGEDTGLKVRSLVDHLTGTVLEYALERGMTGHYESPIPIVGSDGRIQVVQFELFHNHESARVSANKIPLGVFPLSVTDKSDAVFVQYVQRGGRLEVVSLSPSSLVEIQKPFVEMVVRSESPVNMGGGSQPVLEQPLASSSPEIVVKEVPVGKSRVSEPPAFEVDRSSVPEIPQVRADVDLEAAIGKEGSAEGIKSILIESLEKRLIDQGYVKEGKAIMNGRSYPIGKAIDYEPAANILGKTKGALQQQMFHWGIKRDNGIRSEDLLKIKLFDAYTRILSKDDLIALYGAQSEIIEQAQKEGLFTPNEIKPKGDLAIRGVQKMRFYELFDEAVKRLSDSRGAAFETESPPKKEPPKEKETDKPISRVPLAPIAYHLFYEGENEERTRVKLVEAYQPHFNQRKLESLMKQELVQGNNVLLGKRWVSFTEELYIDEAALILGKSASNFQRKYFDLPAELKKRKGNDFVLSPLTALALYPQVEVPSGTITLVAAEVDLFINPSLDGQDRDLLIYMKKSKLTMLKENQPVLHSYLYNPLSKDLRSNWAVAMAGSEKRTGFMKTMGYVDETSAMHHLTGNGVPVGTAYQALQDKLRPYVILGMIPQRALSTIQI
ncbi:MAG: hypothetical protein WC595_02045 [Candidatus Nanoarchaeia archaeon]